MYSLILWYKVPTVLRVWTMVEFLATGYGPSYHVRSEFELQLYRVEVMNMMLL